VTHVPVDEVFGDDYLYFYADWLTDERSDREAAVIADLARLEPGDRVLDVPCGHGRIANRLAARGARVVGIDVTPSFIDIARADAAERGVTADFRLGDMRDLDVADAEFDVVVNWFTAFGYFDDDIDRQVLAGFRRVLAPGGLLIVDTINREHVARLQTIPGRPAFVAERGDDFMFDRPVLDLLTGRSETERVTIRDGVVRRTHFSVRVLTVPEWREWLNTAGFGEPAFLDEDGAPFTGAGHRLVIVAPADRAVRR